jgi:hypothetical protein
MYLYELVCLITLLLVGYLSIFAKFSQETFFGQEMIIFSQVVYHLCLR